MQQMLLGGGAAAKKYIDDVFSTGGYYTTSTGTRTHPTGLDLTSDDGLTIYHRYLGSGVGNAAVFLDTFNRSTKKYSYWHSNSSMQENASTNYWNGFNSSGISLGPYWSSYSSSSNSFPSNLGYNTSFKKEKGFFDLVEWTAGGSTATYSHSLGTQPGFIMIKKLTGSTNQGRVFGYHRQMKADNKGFVKQTNHNDNSRNYVSATSSTFTVSQVNDGYVTAQENGAKYVAYIWADYDSADWGESGDQSIIKCGKYTGDGSSGNGSTTHGQIIDLGWDPHWLLMFGYRGQDMRLATQDLGIGGQGGEWLNDQQCFRYIDLNSQNGEYKGTWPTHTSDYGGVYNPLCVIPGKGFQVRGNGNRINKSGETYYYVAIRKANQKPVDNVSDYFNCIKYTGNNTLMRREGLSCEADLIWLQLRNGNQSQVTDKVGMRRQSCYGSYTKNVNGRLDDRSNGVELVRYNGNYAPAWYVPKTLIIPAQHVWNNSNNYFTAATWKRNHGVMSQINYYGTGGSQTLNHDLGVKPAMIIVMQHYNGTGYSSQYMWCDSAHVADMGDNKVLGVTSDAGVDTRNDMFGDGSGGYVATDSVFRVNTHLNGAGTRSFSAYLFASIPGQVKFGQYTGNGSSTGDSQQINAGFSNGIKWIMIHKISGGDAGTERGRWIKADTARGINNGSNSNDPIIGDWGGGPQFSGDLSYGEAKASQNSSFTGSGNWLETDVIDNNYSSGFVVKVPSSYSYNGNNQEYKWDLNQNGYKYWYWAVAA